MHPQTRVIRQTQRTKNHVNTSNRIVREHPERTWNASSRCARGSYWPRSRALRLAAARAAAGRSPRRPLREPMCP